MATLPIITSLKKGNDMNGKVMASYFFRLYELNFRLMRVVNLENLHILMQNHGLTIPIDNGRQLAADQSGPVQQSFIHHPAD
jgi:flagellin-specific chaperone FliS